MALATAPMSAPPSGAGAQSAGGDHSQASRGDDDNDHDDEDDGDEEDDDDLTPVDSARPQVSSASPDAQTRY